MKRLLTVLAVLGVFAYSGYAKEWAVQGNGYAAYGESVAVGKDGIIFVTGSFQGYIKLGGKKIKGSSWTQTDIFLAAYSPDGKLLWIQTASGQGNTGGESLAVSDDAVYLNAYFEKSLEFHNGKKVTGKGLYSLVIAKYDYKGNLIWVQAATDDENISAYDMALDKKGNAYLVGFFSAGAKFGNTILKPVMEKNIFIAKYSSGGNLEWVNQATGGDSFITGIYGKAIAFGPDGNVYISGEMVGPIKFDKLEYKTSITTYSKSEWLYNREIFIAKYTPDGGFVWMKPVAVNNIYLSEKGLKIDGNGNFCLTGYFDGLLWGTDIGKAKIGGLTIATVLEGGKSIPDIYIAKLDKDCKGVWVKSMGTTGEDQPFDIAVGPNNEIAITGEAKKDAVFDKQKLTLDTSASGAWEFFTAVYSDKGELLDLKTGGGSGNDSGKGVAFDKNGGLYTIIRFSKEAVFLQKKFPIIKYDDCILIRWK